jgi:hypothetical protein
MRYRGGMDAHESYNHNVKVRTATSGPQELIAKYNFCVYHHLSVLSSVFPRLCLLIITQ